MPALVFLLILVLVALVLLAMWAAACLLLSNALFTLLKKLIQGSEDSDSTSVPGRKQPF